jgi:aminoglycoside/choline kinase family phosphotransferase
MTKQQLPTTETLQKLFEEQFGTAAATTEPLAVSGSDRRYYRLSGGNHTAIGTLNMHVAENNSYFYFTELLRKHGIAVPEVYAISKDRCTYLQQDLGSTSLFDLLMQEGFTDNVRQYYHKSITQLARLQWIAGREVDFNQCFATQKFDERAIMADLLYFKYYFADLQKIPYDRILLQDEMEGLSKDLGSIQPLALMFRDFQSRNIMVHQGKVWFIDYQGSMQGPAQYDLASLLWQAKAQLPAAWRENLLNGYIRSMHDLPVPRIDEIHFRKGYAQMVLLRLVQVLGAYGFRGLLERKPHFITSIAPALKNLEVYLSDHPQLPAYPELRKLLENLSSPAMQARHALATASEDAKLVVRICSFSYKKGIPDDASGNGGGYVFDCRGLLNPGRYEAYKHLSGQDTSVKHFLERETKMPQFLEGVYGLVALNVEDYLARGFEHLSVSFGCTGGQHRSVYAAEHLAAYLKIRYGVKVTLDHLNKDSWLRLPTAAS